MGGRKPFLDLNGKPVIYHTLKRFLPFQHRIVQTILILHAEDVEPVRRTLGDELASVYHVTDIIAGGERRQDSVRIALEHTRPEAGIVAIHDGVRPFVSHRAIAESLAKAEECGAAIVASPMKPSVKRVDGGYVTESIDRAGLWGAQTPQVFRRELILRAYEAAERDGLVVTDDAQVVEHLGARVAVVRDSDLNIKITTQEDLRLAEAILAAGLVDPA
ncbi:2-C-methyl-D-erythritol 4-phosphate cytidylyltransferase [bacterium]|nr:2-C-methyl-D-erythritol 4-phosphate cytidylyltransferase [bacterium]